MLGIAVCTTARSRLPSLIAAIARLIVVAVLAAAPATAARRGLILTLFVLTIGQCRIVPELEVRVAQRVQIDGLAHLAGAEDLLSRL